MRVSERDVRHWSARRPDPRFAPRVSFASRRCGIAAPIRPHYHSDHVPAMRAAILAVSIAVLAAASACGGEGNPITGGCTTPGGCGGIDTTTLAPTNIVTGWVPKTLVDNGTTYKYL